MMVMIALDLSKPGDCVAALKNWLPRISRYIRSYHESIDSQQSKAIKAALSEYLSTARLNKGEVVNLASSEQKDGATTESLDFSVDQYDFILENFGLPIIVVGCKLDMMTPEQGTPAKFAREVQGAIRSICLDIGAALIYTSAMEDLNCIELRKYMLHRFYPDKIAADLSIQVRDNYFQLVAITNAKLTVIFRIRMICYSFPQDLIPSI